MIKSETTWDELKSTHPVGSKIRGTVLRHTPFGIFVAIPGSPFDGLVQITDFKDSGRMTPDEYPPVGSPIEAIVLGFKENGKQIWLGMKPSQLRGAEAGDGD
jgi:ribosomal protein S1